MQLKLFDPSASSVSVGSLCETFAEDLLVRLARGLTKPASAHGRIRYLRSFVAHAPTDLVALRNGNLTAWLTDHPEWTSPHTLHTAVGAVISCFRWLAEESLIDRVPFNRRTLRLPTPQPRAAMTRRQADEFLRKIKTLNRGHTKSRHALRIAVWFLARTGCRTCEMRELRWEQVDLDRGVAEMREHKTERTGKPRIIVLPGAVLRILRRHRQSSGLVFRNGRGGAWLKESFARIFKRYLRRTGIPIKLTPYSVRHGFCIACLDDEIHERKIAELMGHSSTRLIEYYGRGAQGKVDGLRDAIDRLGKKKR
jgi:integrase